MGTFLDVGLTGGICCGKSTALRMFATLDCFTLDADSIYHRLIRNGQPLYNRIVDWLGEKILDGRREIDRVILGEIVFNDKKALKKLNSIAHPMVVTEQDRLSFYTHLRSLALEFGALGIGRLREIIEDQSDWPQPVAGGSHHMGTTRMSEVPSRGVVDPNCKVHDVENLYVAGSSVFPTSGSSNPTLTLVALALRLAAHLKENLR